MKSLKGIVISLILAIMPCLMQAKVTTFLGIPVDGTKNEMISKLKAKGFKLVTKDNEEYMNGLIDGQDVDVYITTDAGKVSRIMVCENKMMTVPEIIARFNKLCNQFKNNSDQYGGFDEYEIPANEDISYEMNVNNKRYEAVFHQLPDADEEKVIQDKLFNQLKKKYTVEQIAYPTPQIHSEIMSASTNMVIESCLTRTVWFMISQYSGKYYITMFYDNELNRKANK